MRSLAAMLLAVVSASCASSSCAPGIVGSGVVVDEERPLSGFETVSAAGAVDLFVEIGSPTSVVVEAEDNVLPFVETTVEGADLRVRLSRRLSRSKGVDVRIRVPVLKGLTLSGACKAEIGGLAEERFEVHTSGASQVRVAGACNALAVTVSGASELDLTELRARTASVVASGATEIELWAEEQLDVTASGVSAIRYRGDPRVSQTVSGVGSVSRFDG